MGYSRKGTHVVVHHYARTVHTSTDSVIEHQWHTIVHQSLEMRIAHGILRLWNDNAAHFILIEVLADCHFLVISLIALRHHHSIATRTCLLLDTRKHRRKEIMGKLRNDNTDDLHGLCPTVSESLTNYIGTEIMRPGKRLYTFLLGSTDTRAVLQSSAHRCDRNAQLASNIFHCYDCFLIHRLLVLCAKLCKSCQSSAFCLT